MKEVVCKDTGEVAKTYYEYLKTEHWKNLRSRFGKRYGFRCYICDSSEDLNLHHKTYKRIGNESLQDMIWLCEYHHHLSHNFLFFNKSSKTNLWTVAKKVKKQYLKKQKEQQEKNEKILRQLQ
jgi:hypothetical protein